MYNNLKKFINDSFLINKFALQIDNISYIVLLVMLFGAVIFPSELLGVVSLLFSCLVIFKFIISGIEKGFKVEAYEKTIIVYFLLVTLSLCGSTLFSLSFHGYLKTVVYILFFLCAGMFFKDNKEKIPYTIFFVALLMSYESVVAIIQNTHGVQEISGWQDMTNINPEQVVSRAYGTLKPYNPNLLAGYLLCGLGGFVYLILKFLKKNKKRIALGFCALFLINLIAIIDTGCRGAYLGFMLFFPLLFLALIYYVQKQIGGLSKIKKRYKNVTIASIIGILFFVITNPALLKRVQSIFALRADSSISFRLNVYESVWRMFLDNPFLGIGVGNQNFREIYGLYMKTGYDALGSYCVPLEIAVESGIFALIAFVVFLVFVINKCYRVCVSNDTDINDKILCLSIALMVFATMGHGLFDTIWFRPQVQLLFWCYIAMLNSINGVKIQRD